MITKILLIVDPQNDFITGTLAVEGAKEKMLMLEDYIEKEGNKYNFACVTMDTHPENHCSFKENNGIWPIHCVYETNGWHLPEYLRDILRIVFRKDTYDGLSFYFKGTEFNKEEYSIFDNTEDGEVLIRQISELIDGGGVTVDICGIAGDYCVLETLKGLMQHVSPRYIKVLTQYTASIDGGEKLMNFIKENNFNYE